MTTALIDRPARSDLTALETGLAAAPDETAIVPAHDMRALGLAAAARSLGIRVADLGPLQVRRAKADLVHCPVCPGH